MRLLAAIAFLVVIVFLLDSITPRGVADGAPYVAPVLLAFWLSWQRASLLLGAICSGLILIGFLTSPPGAELGLALANRGLGILAVWIVAILATRLKTSEQNLVDANLALTALHKCNEFLVRAQDEDILTQEVCRIIVQSGGYPLTWLGLFEGDRSLPRRFAKTTGYALLSGRTEDVPWGRETGSGPVATVLRKGDSFQKLNVPADLELAAWQEDARQKGYRSLLFIPLPGREDFLGIFVVGCPKPEGFGLDDRRLLDELAHDLAYGIMALRTRVRHAQAQQQIHLQTAALESAANSVVITDTDGVILWVNPALTRISGYSKEECLGQHTRMFKSGRQDQQFYKQLWDTILSGEVWNGEVVNKRKDGSFYVGDLTITPVRDETGTIRNFVAIMQDITERRATERELRLTQDAVEHFQEIALWVRPNGTLFYVNQRACQALGYSREELLQMSISDIDPTFPPERFAKVWEHIGQRGTVTFETVHRRKDGRIFPVEITANRLEFHGSSYGIAFSRDITERKAAEEDLRRSEERYRDLFENATDIVHTQDLSGHITSLNRAGEQITGYTRQEAVGMNVAQLVAPESLPRLQAEFERILAGETRPPVEMEILAKDGHRLALEGSGRVIREDGEPIGIQAINRDITERKRLEAQFFQAQKIEAVGRLAGGVAHDFNNLLGVILGYSELLLEDLEATQAQQGPLHEIKKAAQQGASLTRQLLAFSRKQVLEPRVLDLNQLLTDMLKMLERLIGEDVTLSFLPAPSLGSVKVDPGQIEQVVMNLVVNARDAMPQGGKLTIETENAELDQAYFSQHIAGTPGPYVLLAVSDTGTGMDAATQARIFEPFFTTKEKGKGTGLGLATVYGIVKQSGGYVWVYSEPGHGSTFKVYFPRFAEEGTLEKAAVTAQATPRGAETILLVEDAEPLRELARLFLEGAGYAVLEASSGPEALEKSRGHHGPIHLLVSDVIMPGMSGAQLAKQLRTERPETKIIFMSGYTDDAIAHHGVLDADVALLVKPFTREALVRKVRDVLDQQGTSRP